MKATVPQAELLKALKAVVRFIPKRPSHPVLANTLIVANDDGTLVISAVSLEGNRKVVNVSVILEASVEGTGSVTAPAVAVRDIVNTAPKGSSITLSFNEGEDRLILSSGNSKAHVGTLPVEDYPTPFLKGTDKQSDFSVNSNSFVEMVKNTIFAASKDTVKEVLNAVNFRVIGNKLVVASTDGHRLSVQELDEVVDTKESEVEFTVPLNIISEVIKVIGKKPKFPSVRMFRGKDSVSVIYGNYTYQFSLTSYQYPNYPQLTPQRFEEVVYVDRGSFLASLERASHAVDPHNNVVRLNFFNTGELTISADNGEDLSYEETIPAQGVKEGIKIGFNVRYLLEALKVQGFDTDRVEMSMNTPTTPAVMRPISKSEAPSLFCLVMPVQLRNPF